MCEIKDFHPEWGIRRSVRIGGCVRLRKKDKKRNIKCIREIVLPECTKGNRQYLGILQSVFAYEGEKELQMQVASLDEEILCGISTRELVWLSENFRNMQWNFLYEYGYEYHTAFWNTDFRRERFMHLSDGQYDAVIKLGTFMADGYGRQECMERLGSTQGALPFLILRMNDWVEPIQESAYVLAKERLNACSLHELLCALPILEKIECAGRRDADRLRFNWDIHMGISNKTGKHLFIACHGERIGKEYLNALRMHFARTF